MKKIPLICLTLFFFATLPFIQKPTYSAKSAAAQIKAAPSEKFVLNN